MAVPDFQTLMRPLLALLGDGGEHSVTELRNLLAVEFALTPEELQQQLPSGRAKTFSNRVGWATTYLYRTGLIERPKRSIYRITDRGRQILTENPNRVDLRVLGQFDEFHDFRSRNDGAPTPPPEAPPSPLATDPDETPEEQIEAAHTLLRSALVAEILDRVMEQSPTFFEDLVLDMLRAMGYGGRDPNRAERLGQSGDEGVDGVIREDELGLDLIYVQAKRWQNPVGRPEIQKFFGALHGKRANKGVFITTSTFSGEARIYAESVTPRVILVDGKELARLMIDYGVGVAQTGLYEIKRIDLDYFATDEDATVIAAGSDAAERTGPRAD